MDKAFMTLQQHFADSRRATVVAINLERRMRTEQIRESAATMTSRRSIDSRMQQTLEKFQARFPSPKRAQKFIFQARLQPVPSSPRRFKVIRQASASSGGGLRRNQVSRMQAVEMGNVAVVHIHFLIIFQPFLQVSFLTDLHGRKLLQVCLKLRHIVRITIQQAGGGNDIGIKAR